MALTEYESRVSGRWLELGIPRELKQQLRMPLCVEASDLVAVGDDMFGRPQQMTPLTAERWQQMTRAAAADGVILQLVSAFRSLDYQCNLIRRKLDDGNNLTEVLKVNAAPGFSEHHTGRALDLSTPECEPLTEAFETTPAFAWLTSHAGRFGFVMSYPRGNPQGIIYEPWHWALIPTAYA